MTAKDAFGPDLRRTRVRRGVSLEQVAERTKIGVDLWEALERNDFNSWPTGAFARAYIRAYAFAVGVDPDSTIDEFCRWFPQGDRRIGAIIRRQAEAAGRELGGPEDATLSERPRGLRLRPSLPHAVNALVSVGHMFGRLRRTLGA